jgi:hypothetical protein
MGRISLAVAALLVPVAVSAGDGTRPSPYRTSVVDVGAPRLMTQHQLERQMSINPDLRSWISYYGYPDVAEYQEVVPQFGWADYEVRTYYLRRNQSLAFGMVASLPFGAEPSMPDYSGLLPAYGLLKYQGALGHDDIDRLSSAPRLPASLRLPAPW